jgi:hypothetical protein
VRAWAESLQIFRSNVAIASPPTLFQVRNFGGESLYRHHRYIFGFHPHAIMPLSCAVGTRSGQWTRLFRDIQPALLTSTVVHYVPLIRDVAQWFGGFEV